MRDHMTVAVLDRLGRPLLRPMNKYRSALGLAPIRAWDDQYLESDRFILFTAEPYEYPRSDWPASVRLVGPGTWEPPATAPEWLETETRPIILVTASTALQDDATLVAFAVRCASERSCREIPSTRADHCPRRVRHIARRSRHNAEVARGRRALVRRAVLPRPVRRRPARRDRGCGRPATSPPAEPGAAPRGSAYGDDEAPRRRGGG